MSVEERTTFAIPLDMLKIFSVLLLVILLPSLTTNIYAQNIDDLDSFNMLTANPSNVIPSTLSDNATNKVIEYKFDPGFYNKIKGMIGGDVYGASAYDDDGYYNVVMVVNGNDDNTIQENKDSLIELLKDIGAKNIKPAVVLAFVTADIPIQEIPGITSFAQIMQIGDGELPIELAIDKSRETIKATKYHIRAIHNTTLTGDGVRVAVFDTGINSIFLNDKVVKRSYCTGDNCRIENGLFTGTLDNPVGLLNSTTYLSHGTRIAAVIASDRTENSGIAPGVDLLDVMLHYYVEPRRGVRAMTIHHAFDWALVNNADIVSASVGGTGCSQKYSYNMIVDQAVNRGLIIVQAAGNSGYDDYKSINVMSCSNNIITVGGIDARKQILVDADHSGNKCYWLNHAIGCYYKPLVTSMFDLSSRGPTTDTVPILKPDIVAPAVSIETLPRLIDTFGGSAGSGTSLSTPMVSAVSALMLEADPTLTPNEVRNLLLLGANWTGPVPCTSSQYEQNNPTDNCSYARQPSDSSRDGIDILNNVGFGILDAQKSINYTLNSDTYMISSYLYYNVTDRHYTITIPDTTQPVKVILTWYDTYHPRINTNIDFNVVCDDQTYSATSQHQANEFVVFNPTHAGECDVFVSIFASYWELPYTLPYEFTISSTVPITTHGAKDRTVKPITPDPAPVVQPKTDDPDPPTPIVPKTPITSPTPVDDANIPVMSIPFLVIGKFDTTGRTIDLYTSDTNKIRIDTRNAKGGTPYIINDKAYIIIYRDTMIINKSFITTNQDPYCYVGDLLVGQDPDIDIPHTNTLQLSFRQAADPTRCDQAPSITFDDKLELSREVYVRLVGTQGQTPFYYADGDIVKIPKCTTTNLVVASKKLLDDTMICYGKDGNDIMIISKILAVFGTTEESLSTSSSTLILDNIIDHTTYTNLVNATVPQTYDISNIDNIFSIIPACNDTVYEFDHDISMTSDGIVIKYTIDKSRSSDSIQSLIVLDDESTSPRTLSVNLVPTGQNSTHLVYTSTIPNNLFNNVDDLSITSYVSSTSNTVHKTGIFSNSSTGSPLFYHNGTSESRILQFMQLPDTDDTVQFVNGTNTGISGTVYIPNGNTVSLSEDILCRYASITPNNIADIFDISPNTISNTTDGLEFALTFADDIPDQINWFAVNSTGDIIRGNTVDAISSDYNFTIPLSVSGTYDITMYGAGLDKILGIHNKSYEFIVPVITQPVTPDPQQPSTPNKNDDTNLPILPITLPESYSHDIRDRTIDLNTYDINKIRIDTYVSDVGTKYYINNVADITIHRNTEIVNKIFAYNTDPYCYSSDLKVAQNIPGITIPIENVSNVLYLQFREHSPDRCDQAPDIDLDGKLILDTEVYVRFANSVDLNPFYYVNGSDNTVDIPKCTDTNFDSASNKLQNDTMICYGKDGDDIVIISKILAVFGVAKESASIPSKPVPVPILVPGNIIDHATYTNLVNTTAPQTYDISNIDNIFSIIPACNDPIYEFDHDISMTSDGILIKYTIEKSRSSDSIQSLIVLDDESTSPRTLSLNLVPTGQNSTHLVYATTIPNNLFNNLDDNIDNLSITSYISSTSSTVHNTGIFSNSSTGSPLFYHNGTSESRILQFMQLPDTDDTVQFVNGTNAGISSNVYIPNGNTVSLSEDILCRYASITPNNIADIFDISPNTISNTTDGLEFALTFADDIPDQINWFAVNSTGDIIRGNTIDTISSDYNFTIPLSVSGTYDITIYGTIQSNKIVGLDNDSYKFTVPDPVPVNPKPDPSSLATHNYQQYADIINSTTLIVHEESDALYNAVPKCDQRQGISYSVIMSSSGDIILEYSTKRDFADGKVLITIKNDTGVSSSISLDPTFVSTNNNRFNYTSIIPNNILDTSSEHLVVNAFFFSTSNTIKNERVYSTSPGGSPLYYHKINGSDPIIVQLPLAAINVPFVSGTVNGVNDPVYIPKGKRISLTDDMFCEFGFIKPKQIARIYEMNIAAANTTDGLEFTYEFERKTFSFGDKTIREPRPSQFNWIVSNSTYNMAGSTTHDIKNTYNFTIPLSQSDDYDVVIYGTNKRGKLIGTHSDSYAFTVKSITQPVTPDPQQPTQPDPPKPVTPVTPDPQQPSAPNKNDDTNLPILPITLPESYSHDIRDRTIDLNTYDINKIRIDTYVSDVGTKYYINNVADITIHRNTEIVNKIFAYNTDPYCYSSDLKVAQNIPGITIPIENVSNVLYLQFREHSPDRCDQAPDIDLDGKLILDTEVYVRFANSVDLNPFYYVNGSDNTVDIPKCTDTNFDSASNKLQNDTMICYGKDGDDIVIISKILAVFGVVVESDPIPLKPVPVPILVPGNIIDHADYTNLVNTTVPQTYAISNIDNIFSIIPACSDTVYEFDHDISMTSDGILIKYTIEKSRSSDSIQSLIVLDDKSTSPRTLSLNLVPTGQNSTHLVYTSTIPNNLFNNVDDLSITSYVSSTSNTVHKTGIFSNSSTGSPLFYHNGTSESRILQFMQLPDTDDTVQFVNGTNAGISSTVYIPNGNTVSLSEDILCRYASITPNNIADIFDISPNTISNTTDGLEFALTFADDIPDQINWFAVNSTGDIIRGNTVDTISSDYNFTIPLSISDTYGITIYGTVQDNKIVGIHDNSYEFTMPVIPDPPTMSISLPDSESLDNNDRTIDLNTLADNSIRIDSYYADTGTRYYINDKADITIYRNTMITDKTFTYQSDQYCYVGDLLVGQNSNINTQHTNTLQLSFRQADDPTRCDNAPIITFDDKLELSQEIYVRFVGAAGQTPFYHIDDNTVEISKCTDSNFDSTSSTLRGNAEVCYGKSGNDTILVSKILAVFGTTTDDL